MLMRFYKPYASAVTFYLLLYSACGLLIYILSKFWFGFSAFCV